MLTPLFAQLLRPRLYHTRTRGSSRICAPPGQEARACVKPLACDQLCGKQALLQSGLSRQVTSWSEDAKYAATRSHRHQTSLQGACEKTSRSHRRRSDQIERHNNADRDQDQDQNHDQVPLLLQPVAFRLIAGERGRHGEHSKSPECHYHEREQFPEDRVNPDRTGGERDWQDRHVGRQPRHMGRPSRRKVAAAIALPGTATVL